MVENKNLVQTLKNIGFINEMFNYVNQKIPNILNVARENNLTIQEWVEKMESDKVQQSVKISVIISDIIQEWIVFKANKFFIEKGIKYLYVIPFTENKIKWEDNKNFDVIFNFKGENIRLEIKTSQSENSFTGATHGKNKVSDYLLINYRVNKNLKVENKQVNYFTSGVFAAIVKVKGDEFVGEATKKSSFTSFKFNKNSYSLEYIKEHTLVGDIDITKKNKKSYTLVLENL
jgi:hypothetical protein